jgi:hypothetical protein
MYIQRVVFLEIVALGTVVLIVTVIHYRSASRLTDALNNNVWAWDCLCKEACSRQALEISTGPVLRIIVLGMSILGIVVPGMFILGIVVLGMFILGIVF